MGWPRPYETLELECYRGLGDKVGLKAVTGR